jgi:glycosyltransferase involved in cell wall biosynthesis
LIHRELLKQGHQSKMAVMVKQKDDPHIHILGNKLTQFYDKIVSVIEMVLGLQRLLPISGYCLFFKKYYWKADLIHLHLIHSESFFSLLLLPIITRRHKVVLTLHDPWIMTGHCIHPFDCQRWRFGCGSCPNLVIPFYVNRDSTAFMWRLKKMLLDHSNLTIVVASNWMAEFVSLSPLVSRFPCQIIPFGMDVTNVIIALKISFGNDILFPKMQS